VSGLNPPRQFAAMILTITYHSLLITPRPEIIPIQP
jgi:hypothetical protein